MRVLWRVPSVVAMAGLLMVFGVGTQPASADEIETKKSLETVDVGEIVDIGETVEFDRLSIGPEVAGATGEYQVNLTLVKPDLAELSIIDLRTGDELPEVLVVDKYNIETHNSSGVGPTPVGDYAASNYEEWCGKWRKGVLSKRWRWCTGADCKGKGSLVCIQRQLPEPPWW